MAMNPNLTPAQFAELYAEDVRRQCELLETLRKNASDLRAKHGPKLAADYVLQCLPLVLM